MWRRIHYVQVAGSGPKRASSAIRHLYLDLDTDADSKLAALQVLELRSDAERNRIDISRANTRCFGGSKTSPWNSRKARSSCWLWPSVAILLAPIATGFFAYRDS